MANTWNFAPASLHNDSNKDILDLIPETLTLYQSFMALRQRRDKVSHSATLNFKKVTEDDILTLSKFFKKYPSRSCDYSIGGILMWADYFDYSVDLVNDTLFIKGYDKESDTILYYEPLGSLDRTTCHRMIAEDMVKNSSKSILISAEEISYPDFINAPQDDRYIYDWKEYLYQIEKFTNFSGKKMEKKRNHLNSFLKRYPDYTIEIISENNIGDLIQFSEKFEQNHTDSDMFLYESCQTMRVLKSFLRYPFEGILIKDKDQIIAYSFGEKIGDTFFLHVEKADITYDGVYQAIASFMSRYIKEKYPDVIYLNREEDMGNESLRKSKESYHPFLIVNKKRTILPL